MIGQKDDAEFGHVERSPLRQSRDSLGLYLMLRRSLALAEGTWSRRGRRLRALRGLGVSAHLRMCRWRLSIQLPVEFAIQFAVGITIRCDCGGGLGRFSGGHPLADFV